MVVLPLVLLGLTVGSAECLVPSYCVIEDRNMTLTVPLSTIGWWGGEERDRDDVGPIHSRFQVTFLVAFL